MNCLQFILGMFVILVIFIVLSVHPVRNSLSIRMSISSLGLHPIFDIFTDPRVISPKLHLFAIINLVSYRASWNLRLVVVRLLQSIFSITSICNPCSRYKLYHLVIFFLNKQSAIHFSQKFRTDEK